MVYNLIEIHFTKGLNLISIVKNITEPDNANLISLDVKKNVSKHTSVSLWIIGYNFAKYILVALEICKLNSVHYTYL